MNGDCCPESKEKPGWLEVVLIFLEVCASECWDSLAFDAALVRGASVAVVCRTFGGRAPCMTTSSLLELPFICLNNDRVERVLTVYFLCCLLHTSRFQSNHCLF